MKIIVIFVLAALLASAVYANGGNQKYVDGYLVQLSSLPISPFAGERFSAIISFADISGDLL
ncbi:MAG: hypothetical protein HY517_03630, partial [Candidatus Aenigmarchaeota archaeon]|nr:hypothetical protein [Candidatus Aenigmarchaeota archaeon]